MSLIHFTLTNPDWKPPQESENFIHALHGQVVREAEALPTVLETEGASSLEENVLFVSLNGARFAGELNFNVLKSMLFAMKVTLLSPNRIEE